MKHIITAFLIIFYSPMLCFAQEENTTEEEIDIDYKKRGKGFYKRGQYTAAIEDFTKALKKGGDTKSEIYQYRAKARRKTGNYTESLKDYNQAIQINANFTKAYLGRAQTYTLLKEYKKAIKDYDMVLAKSPNHPKRMIIYFNQAILKEYLKDYQGALEYYNKVLQLDKNFAKAYTNRGNILYLKGDVRGACADWQQAKDLENVKGKINVEKACQ